MIGWRLAPEPAAGDQLALDVGGPESAGEVCESGPGDTVPIVCAGCSNPCPWTNPDDDDLSWAQWWALLPRVCSRSTTKT